MNFKDKMVLFLATAGYVGRIPFAPGTFGSALGLIACYLISLASLSIGAVAVILIILIAVWVADHAERLLEKKDPGCVVIDEVAGMVVTLLGIPLTGVTAVGGFFLFRLFDIVKPSPVRFFQDNCPGGAGVVLDDIAAGIFANLLLRALCLIFGIQV